MEVVCPNVKKRDFICRLFPFDILFSILTAIIE